MRIVPFWILSLIFASAAGAEDAPMPPALMSFAQGTLPVAIDTGDSNLRVGMEHAVALIDGNPVGFVAMGKPAVAGDFVEITYQLPALTVFTRFAVPNILETPSPSQSFFKSVSVFGTVEAAGPFLPLAEGVLAEHARKGLVTELDLREIEPLELR